jgi:hypothetical protein
MERTPEIQEVTDDGEEGTLPNQGKEPDTGEEGIGTESGRKTQTWAVTEDEEKMSHSDVCPDYETEIDGLNAMKSGGHGEKTETRRGDEQESLHDETRFQKAKRSDARSCIRKRGKMSHRRTRYPEYHRVSDWRMN